MNKLQIKKFKDTLNKLENFINDKPEFNPGVLVEKIRKIAGIKIEDKRFEESEIYDWIAECSSLFSEVGVNQAIISNFLKFFEFSTKEEDDGLVKRIGPFVTVGWRSKTYGLSNIFDFNNTKIAFQCARVNLGKLIEEDRIVPIWLLNEFLSNDNTKNLYSSLELIENCYQKRDKNGMIINTNNLLDSILNLDEDLKNNGKNTISKKLCLLLEDENKLMKLGASKDVIAALNSFRLIRNKKVVHSDSHIKHNIPFLVAVSFAYLTIFFMESFILNSTMFEKDS
jgi:hypothetical protein